MKALFYFAALGPDLYDDGFLNVTNVDISSVVINQMADMHRAKEEIECTIQRCNCSELSLLILLLFFFCSVSHMDARKMEFIPDQCFDLIIDKGNANLMLSRYR